ncbi:MAG: hypothetical protein A2Y12_07245 [Planctomycetes bacterium GWF2_42_9]|nr:MAG: hypothetical protein A2Y12_07245 [Planctomycetes bacterium GWF2_42_9]
MNSGFMSTAYYTNQQYGQDQSMYYGTNSYDNKSILGNPLDSLSQYTQFMFGKPNSYTTYGTQDSNNSNSIIAKMLDIVQNLIPLVNKKAQYPQYPAQSYPQYQDPTRAEYITTPYNGQSYQAPYNSTNDSLSAIMRMFRGQPQQNNEYGVSANKMARVWGDPHVEGANGKKFDFQDEGIYNLLDDKNVNINCKTGKWKDNTTVVKDVGIMAGDQYVKISVPDPTGQVTGFKMLGGANIEYRNFVSGPTVSVNGKDVQLKDGETMDMPNGIKIKRAGNNYEVKGAEYDLTVEYDKGGYLNLNANSSAAGVLADGVAPTGILGETFDPNNTKEGLKNDIKAYERKDLFDDGAQSSRSKSYDANQPYNNTPNQNDSSFLNYLKRFFRYFLR